MLLVSTSQGDTRLESMIVDRGRVAAALPSYELGAELGAGSFGVVLAARHRELHRDVAVKIVPTLGSRASPSVTSEARVLAGLDHPHIVRVYDYVENDGLAFIIMELLAGGSLAKRQAILSPLDACVVGIAAAQALACAHTWGVLHRDIKPDNMLFNASGVLKVTDFGIAKVFKGSAVSASTVAGTPGYMAPEQRNGKRVSPVTDIYALGVVLYELLAGRLPYDPHLSLSASHHLTPDPIPDIPTAVADVVMQALEKDPSDRHPTARTFARSLADAATWTYGPSWIDYCGIALHLDHEIRAVLSHAGATPPPHPTTPGRAGSRGNLDIRAETPAAVGGDPSAAYDSAPRPTPTHTGRLHSERRPPRAGSRRPVRKRIQRAVVITFIVSAVAATLLYNLFGQAAATPFAAAAMALFYPTIFLVLHRVISWIRSGFRSFLELGGEYNDQHR